MSFELAQAFVSLTERGFDGAIAAVDGTQVSMLEMQNAAEDATGTFEGALTDAFLSAAADLGLLTEEVDTSALRMANAQFVASQLSKTIRDFEALELSVNDRGVNDAIAGLDQIIAAVDTLDDEEIEFLSQLEEQISSAVEKAQEMRRITAAIAAFDAAAKPAVKTIEELNAQLTDTKESFGDVNKGIDDWVKSVVEAADGRLTESFDEVSEGVADVQDAMDQLGPPASAATKFGRLFGTLAAGAAVVVGIVASLRVAFQISDDIAQKAFGYNDALERRNSLLAEGNRLRDKALNAELALAKAAGADVEIEKLRKLEADALKAKDAASAGLRNAKEAQKSLLLQSSDIQRPGAVEGNTFFGANAPKDPGSIAATLNNLSGPIGQLVDGKFNSQLAEELTQAEEKLKAATELWERLQDARENAEDTNIANEAAETLAAEKKIVDEAKKRIEAYDDQLAAVRLQNIEVTEGAEAAARARDKAAGFTLDQRRELSRIRQATEAERQKQDQKKEAAAENLRNANREAAEQKQTEDSFARQMQKLRERNVELNRGVEASAKLRDEAAGFSDEQRKQLAHLRAANNAMQKLQEAEKEIDDLAKQQNEASGDVGFVGFADLASKMQDALNNSEAIEFQRATAKAVIELEKRAAGAGIKVEIPEGLKPPEADRRFGRGAATKLPTRNRKQ